MVGALGRCARHWNGPFIAQTAKPSMTNMHITARRGRLVFSETVAKFSTPRKAAPPSWPTWSLRLHEAGDQITESLPQLIEEWRTASPVIAFENASVSHVEGVSVLRLTHRAATDNAKVWYRDLCQECDRAFFFVEMAARSYFPQISGIVQEIQNTPNFKEAISMKINDSSISSSMTDQT